MVTKQDIKDVIFNLRVELLEELSKADGITEPAELIKYANKIMGGRIMLEKIDEKIEQLPWEENNG